jgi:RHS repeat-associated protein
VYIFANSKVIAEYDNGAVPTAPSREYVYGGSVLLAKIDSAGTKYYHQDRPSNRLVTNSSGTVIEQLGHYPFGNSWYNATNDKLYFTSYERDSGSNSDFAMARFYESSVARFTSPDPAGSRASAIADPQSLNRFSYTKNDPVNAVDPQGLSPCLFERHGFSETGYYYYLVGCLSNRPAPLAPPTEQSDGVGSVGKYTVNLKVLNDCLSQMGIHTKINSFTVSTPGGYGSATGVGEDTFSGHGDTVPITVTNDAHTYNAVQVGQLCHEPSAYGCTLSKQPYTNYTNNNNNAFGTVDTQVWELANSLWVIQAGSSLIPVPTGDKEPGKVLENCVKANHGIQAVK